jgi:hypothetical protein
MTAVAAAQEQKYVQESYSEGLNDTSHQALDQQSSEEELPSDSEYTREALQKKQESLRM